MLAFMLVPTIVLSCTAAVGQEHGQVLPRS